MPHFARKTVRSYSSYLQNSIPARFSDPTSFPRRDRNGRYSASIATTKPIFIGITPTVYYTKRQAVKQGLNKKVPRGTQTSTHPTSGQKNSQRTTAIKTNKQRRFYDFQPVFETIFNRPFLLNYPNFTKKTKVLKEKIKGIVLRGTIPPFYNTMFHVERSIRLVEHGHKLVFPNGAKSRNGSAFVEGGVRNGAKLLSFDFCLGNFDGQIAGCVQR